MHTLCASKRILLVGSLGNAGDGFTYESPGRNCSANVGVCMRGSFDESITDGFSGVLFLRNVK